MDNSMTTWIIVALLVLLIGAAIFMLLRRPGGDDSLDGRDAPAVDRDTDRRGDLDGRTAPEETQAVAADGGPPRDDAPFDQTSYGSPAAGQTSYGSPAAGAGVTGSVAGGATPVDRADVADRAVADEGYDASPAPHVADDTTETSRPADDFFGVDREPREEVEPDPLLQDPRTDGHLIADDEVRHDGATAGGATAGGAAAGGVAGGVAAGGVAAGGVAGDRPGDEGYLGAPASEGYHATPASEGYHAVPADEQASQAPPAASVPPQQQPEDTRHLEQADRPAGGDQSEPLTADEVLDSRDVADRDHGDGYAEPPVATGAVADEPAADEPAVDAPAVEAPAVEAPAVDAPQVDEQRSAPAGGQVFAESVYGVGSVEPAEDGTGPEGWEVKGNTGSMLFHTADSPSYDAVRAEVWFDSEESARNAGFAHWDRRRR